VRGLAVVGLAGAIAVVAARGWLRPVVGLVLVLAGVGMVVAGLGFDPDSALARGSSASLQGTGSTPWPVLAAVCGAVLATAGALVAARGRRWGGMSQRYDSPVAAAAPEPQGAAEGGSGERQLWEALDRGEDPTGPDLTAPPGQTSPGPPPTGGADLPSR
jgi:uncharacterized membrane protein (TIGR02234 family)